HGLPSLQAAPLGAFGFEQMPVTVLHVPAAWHWSLAKQTTAFAPTPAPGWRVSVCVQGLPSLQAVPFAALPWTHAESTQVSVVQGLFWLHTGLLLAPRAH